MSELLPDATTLCGFLLTYLVHSSAIIVAAALIARRLQNANRSDLRVLIWKLALILPTLTTSVITIFEFPHVGAQLALPDSAEAVTTEEASDDLFVAANEVIPIEPRMEINRSNAEIEADVVPVEAARSQPAVSLPELKMSALWTVLAVAWCAMVVVGFIRLSVQMHRLRRLRLNASEVREPALIEALRRILEQMRSSRRVELLQSADTMGPMTAGIRKPFIMLPAGIKWHAEDPGDGENDASPVETEAVLAHEVAHIVHRDAIWNFIAQVVVGAFPFQPLQRWVARQLKKDMDFVADLHAVRMLRDPSGLIQSLMRLGRIITSSTDQNIAKAGLAAGMVAFRSTLGQRVEVLLNGAGAPSSSPRSLKLKLLIVMTSGATLVAALLPRAVADTPHKRNPTMKEHLTTLALLVGLTSPAAAVDEKPAAVAKSAELKTTPDPLPDGIRNFNGMLVGRLAAKDVEKGTFVVLIDAVPRVWRNSRAEDPKSIVGKTIEVGGVFGKFLDVLVVTRQGETLEFECKYDGEKLVFPGEMLRKVAPYKAEDYPVLPEAFRGFRGTVDAEVIKKDPETFELILKVRKVVGTGEGNSAKDPESIEGKPLMLAGFWNRKDTYHDLKVGDRIKVGMQHIAKRSDHMNVTEVSRQADDSPKQKTERREGDDAAGGLSRELRGFRGMLVGKLVEKDIERGTFSIKVDAVPRVWNNNKASKPKAFIGKQADAGGVHGKLLDALVVTRVGETIEFGALNDEGGRLRVGEVLRKVAPVKAGDYPELPDGFRGFKGMLTGKVIKKDDQLMDLIIEVKSIDKPFEGSRAKQAESIVGKRAILAGFWRRKEAFHNINVGDTIRCGVEHPQRLSDHLSVIESVKKVEE